MSDLLNLFCHGYVTVPFVEACRRRSLFERLNCVEYADSSSLSSALHAHPPALMHALRALETVGWVESKRGQGYRLVEAERDGWPDADLTALYAFSCDRLLQDAQSAKLLGETIDAVAGIDATRDRRLAQGAVVIPLIGALRQCGVDGDDTTSLQRVLEPLDGRLAASIGQFFLRERWADAQGETMALTATGIELLRGETVALALSYRQLLASVEGWFSGSPGPVTGSPLGSEASQRRSAALFGSALDDTADAIVEIFNQEPLERQPAAIVQVGCEDAALLKRAYERIGERGLRGQHLQERPLEVFAVCRTQQALQATSETLTGAGIRHRAMSSEVSRPECVAKALALRGLRPDQSTLHLHCDSGARLAPSAPLSVDSGVALLAAEEPGLYLDPTGQPIEATAVLSSWQRHVHSLAAGLGGTRLLMTELHSVASSVVLQRLEQGDSFYFNPIHHLVCQYPISAEALLVLLAGAGLFNRTAVKRLPGGAAPCRISLHDLERRDYLIRPAEPADSKRLYQLEELCWRHSRTPRQRIRARVLDYPRGQFVLEVAGRVVAAIYSQRIADSDALFGRTAADIHELHDPCGPLVQLLAVNVDPQAQSCGYGDQLLEFMLQRCELMPGVTRVVGVTLCTHYRPGGAASFADYLRTSGAAQDPVLAFHEAHGARIVRPVPGYRPQDLQNETNGVLVSYDIPRRAVVRVAAPPAVSSTPAPTGERPADREEIEAVVRHEVIELLGERRAGFEAERPLMEMGLDSAELLKLQQMLQRRFGFRLPPAFFFEFNSVRKVAAHLADRFAVPAAALSGHPGPMRDSACANGAAADAAVLGVELPSKMEVPSQVGRPQPVVSPTDIAIIGMSCRLPGGINSPADLWDVLSRGISVIGRYPPDRGRWPSGHEHPGIESGGFVLDADRFDADFFRISPTEAQITDPQQRLMLELAWQCLEDAGIPPAVLQGSPTGVFVGASNCDYSRLIQDTGLEIQPHQGVGSSLAVLANRVSYFFDWTGPSLLIDTACSSSLVALHTAIQSLRSGDCAVALVGGVNLICHPDLSIAYHKAGMLSPDGRCKTFDARADGYVRSEGGVVLLLKPLAAAIEGQDQIHAVIKGSAINHGGLAGGLTVPNPVKQSELLRAAWKNSAVAGRDVSYIEVHGTGTALGDPIEVQGIRNALDATAGGCAIGSVKSNLGHLESAAGLAGLLKVVLSLQHGALPASINFTHLNSKIELQGSALRIQDELSRWDAPGRLAGVSSFGSGGANAHVVLQEYPGASPHGLGEPRDRASGLQATEHLFVLSAKTPARLWDAASTLTNWLRTNAIDNRFADAIYTWQTGRSAMQTRLALRVRDQADLSSKLGRWLADPDRTGSPSSDVSRDSADSALNRLWHSSAGQRWVVEALRARDLEQLALMWMAGLDVDWHGLYGGLEARHRPQRMSLPGYAFARDRHWIEATGAGACTSSGTSRTSGVLHPLLHANTSDFSCQSYRTRLTGEEFFLRDHRVRLPDEANETPRSAASVRLPAQRVLPAVAYLEMARQAVESALPFAGNAAAGSECPRFELRDTVWVRPFVVTQARQLSIVLRGDAQNHIEFELSSAGPAGEEVVYCQGRAVPAVAASVGRADINDLQSKLQQGVLQNEGLYEAFARMGFEYGPAHRVIQTLYEGDGQLLARVRLPAVVARTQPDYVLHPSLLDGALQAAIALLSGFETSPGSPLLPYAVRSLRLNSPCPPEMWVWARRNELEPGEVDMDLCHTSGEIAVQLRGFCAVRFGEAGRGSNPEGGLPAVEETVLAVPQWQLSEPKSNSTSYAGRHVLLCGLDLAKGGRVGDARTQIHTCPIPAGASLPELYREYARFCFKTVRSLLLTPSQDTVLIQVVAPDDGTATLAAGLSGLLESAALENPRLRGQVLLMDPLRPVADSTHLLELESRSSDLLVRHSSTQRWALGWTVVSQELPPAPLAWKNDGVYLITGGLGGLGTLLAREILSQVPRAKIVLTGRTQLNEAKRSVLDNLAPQQQIRYCSLDLTDCAKVHECVAGIVREHGQLNGILHCAGMIADDFIIRKSEADLLRVLAPKVDGTCHLDEASRDLQLDFFVLFSSVTAVVGMVGQADYAAANGFLDQFASHRDQLVAAGHRSGRTLSINWPLWQDGGMRMDPVNIESFRQRTGATPIRTGDALEAFYRALSLPASRCMVMRGEVSRLLHTLRSSGTIQEAAVPGQGAVIEPLRKSELLQRTEEFICLEFATVLKFPAHRVEPHATLEHYGIDSILAVSLIRQLEKSLGPLSKTLLFEYRSVRDLARHLVDVFPARLAARLSLAHAAPEMPRAVPLPRIDSAIHRRTAGSDTNRFRHSVGQASRPSRGPASLPSASAETIAIVGLSGRYPQSDTLEAYWENLRSGRDCIVEIPPDRWEWRHHYTPDRTRNGRHYSKWGGFISGVDEFDPRFFNIAPREAQFMDPQERLFLQHAWMAVEDAGYSRAMLQMPGEDELPGQVGVYVGVMWSEYQLHAAHADPEHQRMGFAGNLASIANRVSYVLNLHGPSVALDTMCSSSLTAIHFACQGLRDGATSMAIAGGVNVSIHPNKYLLLSVGQFISSDGRCQSFGEGGEGYIPGEGVGAVVLKRLSDAERDGDHVYGLIKGSALSHGGRTHGYTVPNPQAQASAIGRALTAANVQARHVSYVEAHGTGTKLGDPIEIAALARVFEKNTAERGFCLIGSAKSNIGHTEAAAGIAGLTKVLLQMQHRQIAPSLHSSRLNPHIDFAQSPFVVNQTLRAWERPVVSGQEQPRIAGVSSFGAGGANAHLIVQEYLPAPKPSAVPVIQPTTAPVAIVLSARTAADLSVKARQLLSFIRERALAEPQDLVRMAYTLQVGREPLEERLGLLAGSFSQLTEILARYGDAGAEKVPEGVYRGRAKSNRGVPTTSGSGAEELLRSWVSGTQVDWQTLYGGGRPQRMSLPTYPFAKERYWIDSNATGTSSTNASANSNANATNTANTINGTHGTASPAPATCRAAAQVRGISLEIPAELVARRADPGRRIAQPPVFRLTPLIQSDNLSAEVTFRRQEQGIFAIELAATRCHNRLDRALVEQLGRALAAAGGEPDLKVLLICGAEDCFACGGADSVDAAITGRLYESLAAFPYPTIAVLRGRATGAGFLLGAMCDFMICAEETFYGFTDPQTASLPSEPVARYFGARFGNALSRGLLYEATAVTGAELGRRLWSCTIVPAAQVLARGRELAGRLADKSPLALRLLKQHLAKPLRALVEELRAGDAVEPGQESGLPGGIAPARQSHPGSEGRPIEPESAGPGVKLVRLPANPAPQVLRSLITDLEFALRAVSEDATCKALVLTFTDDEPSSTTELEVSSSGDDELLELCNVLLSSAVPVVAAMTARTEGIAWFWSLYCDACIYGEEGTYSAARICASPNLQLKRGAAGAFAHRFDEVLAAELLLAGARFSGVELARRSGGLTVVPGSEVIPAAIALAQRWSRQTREMLVAWKRQAAREVQQRLLPVAYPESVSTARTRQGSEQGAVHSPVASASPRVIPLSTDVVTAVLSPEGVLEVVLADREAKNMFSEALITGVKEAFAYAADVPDCKVIVLRGYDRYFASGGTKESLLAIHAGKARFTDFEIFHLALDCPVPVVAAMQGHAIGAGWSLGMFADIPVLSADCRYVSPYMDYGFTPGAGATLIFPKRMGLDLARETLLTGTAFEGEQLQRRGSNLRVLAREEVVPTARSLALGIARQSRAALVSIKDVLARQTRNALPETYRGELAMHEETFVGQSSVRELIERRFPQAPQPLAAANTVAVEETSLHELSSRLRSLLARELRLPESDIADDVQFVDLGLDSISGVTWIRKINETYGLSVEAANVYSYPTLAQLSRHVGEEMAKSGRRTATVSAVAEGDPIPTNATTSRPAVTSAPAMSSMPAITSWPAMTPARVGLLSRAPPVQGHAAPEAIAIVGLAGQFPQARNPQEFWKNIASGRNCVVPIPPERWNVDAVYAPGSASPGTTNSKWMGALEDYDRFDPLFFNISPAEAESMDPQQRLFLQSCWNCIENAGYSAKALSATNCGVFVGCTQGDYQQLSSRHRLSAHGFTGGAPSVLAARISYFLNLQGPCISIDTACSSSLVALAQACDSLISRGSDMALAGGVFVMATAEMHIKTTQAGMLSSDGRCFSFDQRANGFVPGEAVGAVLLKRLSDAERDGDAIHAVIEGWGINQDGKSNGITAPNPQAQARLQRGVYERFNLDPGGIQLIEAHGTGTQLGDPIEVQGLVEAFGGFTRKAAYCALGSVKSNIGHCVTAAGIAGVIKMVLALKNRQLPPTINFEQLNAHISLDQSPFYVNTELRDWEPGNGLRRRGAVSSFGFSGTNAHLVIGEYTAPRAAPERACAGPTGPQCLLPLSAKTPAQLQQRVHDLLEFVRAVSGSEAPGRVALTDLAYTLQVGREPMAERLGLIVSSWQQLTDLLQALTAAKQPIASVFRGPSGNDPALGAIGRDDDIREAIMARCLSERKYAKLLELWTRGLEVDWAALYRDRRPQRVTLPEYPFARNRYWVEAAVQTVRHGSSPPGTELHPLLQTDTSDLTQHSFSATFSGAEPFLRDHRVRAESGGEDERPVLPGVAYLEMARTAIQHAAPAQGNAATLELHDTVWEVPCFVTAECHARIAIWPLEGDEIEYEIGSGAEGQDIVHCRGRARLCERMVPARVDLDELRGQMRRGELSGDAVYAAFSRMGLVYGPAHRGLTTIYQGQDQLLARLRLPDVVSGTEGHYVLHPSLMDAALQASIGLSSDIELLAGEPVLPFALRLARVTGGCCRDMLAWVRRVHGGFPGQTLEVDVDILDPDGHVRIEIQGLLLRTLRRDGSGARRTANVPDNEIFDEALYRQVTQRILDRELSVEEAAELH